MVRWQSVHWMEQMLKWWKKWAEKIFSYLAWPLMKLKHLRKRGTFEYYDCLAVDYETVCYKHFLNKNSQNMYFQVQCRRIHWEKSRFKTNCWTNWFRILLSRLSWSSQGCCKCSQKIWSVWFFACIVNLKNFNEIFFFFYKRNTNSKTVFGVKRSLLVQSNKLHFRFMVCADYDAYIKCQQEVEKVYLVCWIFLENLYMYRINCYCSFKLCDRDYLNFRTFFRTHRDGLVWL